MLTLLLVAFFAFFAGGALALGGRELRAAGRDFALDAGLPFFWEAAFLVDLATETPTPFAIHRRHIGRRQCFGLTPTVKPLIYKGKSDACQGLPFGGGSGYCDL